MLATLQPVELAPLRAAQVAPLLQMLEAPFGVRAEIAAMTGALRDAAAIDAAATARRYPVTASDPPGCDIAMNPARHGEMTASPDAGMGVPHHGVRRRTDAAAVKSRCSVKSGAAAAAKGRCAAAKSTATPAMESAAAPAAKPAATMESRGTTAAAGHVAALSAGRCRKDHPDRGSGQRRADRNAKT